MNGKRKLKERVLSLVLAFAMVVSMVIEPLQIRAADASADADAQIEGEPMLLDEESGMGEDDTEEDGTEEDGPEEDNTEEDVDDSVESAITLDKESLELQVGDEGALTPTTAPEGSTVEWESDNEDVATVNDGTVTAMGVGEATITASLQDDPSVQAIATVTVSEKIYTVTGKVFGTSQVELRVRP